MTILQYAESSFVALGRIKYHSNPATIMTLTQSTPDHAEMGYVTRSVGTYVR